MKRAHEMAGSTHAIVRCKSKPNLPNLATLFQAGNHPVCLFLLPHSPCPAITPPLPSLLIPFADSPGHSPPIVLSCVMLPPLWNADPGQAAASAGSGARGTGAPSSAPRPFPPSQQRLPREVGRHHVPRAALPPRDAVAVRRLAAAHHARVVRRTQRHQARRARHPAGGSARRRRGRRPGCRARRRPGPSPGCRAAGGGGGGGHQVGPSCGAEGEAGVERPLRRPGRLRRQGGPALHSFQGLFWAGVATDQAGV
jgi:hypothetical protein